MENLLKVFRLSALHSMIIFYSAFGQMKILLQASKWYNSNDIKMIDSMHWSQVENQLDICILKENLKHEAMLTKGANNYWWRKKNDFINGKCSLVWVRNKSSKVLKARCDRVKWQESPRILYHKLIFLKKMTFQ